MIQLYTLIGGTTSSLILLFSTFCFAFIFPEGTRDTLGDKPFAFRIIKNYNRRHRSSGTRDTCIMYIHIVIQQGELHRYNIHVLY